MSDLVERLRGKHSALTGKEYDPEAYDGSIELFIEAADEIERLEAIERRGKANAKERFDLIAENKRLQARLKALDDEAAAKDKYEQYGR